MAKNLTKDELVTRLSETSGVSKTDIKAVLNSLKPVVTQALKEDLTVKVGDVVTFGMVDRKATTAPIPGTKDRIDVPACRALKCKAVGAFQKEVKVVK